MKIRSATLGDEAAVTALWKECGLTVPYNDPAADFRFALSKFNSDILVTEDLSGTVMVGHDGHRGWLYYLAVAPARRRQGVGRTLVDAAEQWLAARDVPKVQLMVRETNTAVVAFYQRLGFDPMPRINMQKWLKLEP
jgi:ribosomal protein S18 acetylase RimI-like enzyme